MFVVVEAAVMDDVVGGQVVFKYIDVVDVGEAAMIFVKSIVIITLRNN